MNNFVYIIEINPMERQSDPQNLLSKCMYIRQRVLQVGQNVPHNEDADGKDKQCLHMLAKKDGEQIGTCRVRPFVDNYFAEIERMAVLEKYASQSIAKVLYESAIACSQKQWPQLLVTSTAGQISVADMQKTGMVSYDFDQGYMSNRFMKIPKSVAERDKLHIWEDRKKLIADDDYSNILTILERFETL